MAKRSPSRPARQTRRQASPSRATSRRAADSADGDRSDHAADGGRQAPYEILLRTLDRQLAVRVTDQQLYPHSVAWNRLLNSDRGRQSQTASDQLAWQDNCRQTLTDLAVAGGVARGDVEDWVVAAAKCRCVQVEIPWEREDVGWAARVFPWESVLALATKSLRAAAEVSASRPSGSHFAVVRRLRRKARGRGSAKGPICFAVQEETRELGSDVDAERAAISAAIRPKKLVDLAASSREQLARSLQDLSPRLLHYASASTANDEAPTDDAAVEDYRGRLEELAQALGGGHPALLALSSSFTGRRLAPLAVAHGAEIAIGFHDTVSGGSLPVFFGAFYREWVKSENTFTALLKGLEAHHWRKPSRDLGAVTVWSSTDLLGHHQAAEGGKPRGPAVRTLPAADTRAIPVANIVDSLKVTCVLGKSLNYSMLHNRHGGLFEQFDVLKLRAGSLQDLEVTVKVDTGFDRPAECHFFAPLPTEVDRTIDLSQNVTMPLGSELLRRRGEMLRGTVEVLVRCGDVKVFHCFDSIELPPCDEWNDDEAGRRYLPSFVLPRDPAVREVISAAQPFLRVINDQVRAAFSGYQAGAAAEAAGERVESDAGFESLRNQVRAIWAALQHGYGLDYSNPLPSYTVNVQRIRTPEEVLRSRRGTCLDLTLLLASCLEHVGIFPVIFLVPQHAFAGFWTSSLACDDFFDPRTLIAESRKVTLSRETKESVKDRTLDLMGPKHASGGGIHVKEADWLLRATHHQALISRAVKLRQLVPLEATCVAQAESFGDAVDQGRARLADAFACGQFDGMLDIRTARSNRVTPLAIVADQS